MKPWKPRQPQPARAVLPDCYLPEEGCCWGSPKDLWRRQVVPAFVAGMSCRVARHRVRRHLASRFGFGYMPKSFLIYQVNVCRQRRTDLAVSISQKSTFLKFLLRSCSLYESGHVIFSGSSHTLGTLYLCEIRPQTPSALFYCNNQHILQVQGSSMINPEAYAKHIQENRFCLQVVAPRFTWRHHRIRAHYPTEEIYCLR